MPQPEIIRQTTGLVGEGTVFDVLNEYEHARAAEVNRYVVEWVMAPGNLSSHGRAMFMYSYSKGAVHTAFSHLVQQFADVDSVIPPSEPMIWQEWAAYWYRGFWPDDLPKH